MRNIDFDHVKQAIHGCTDRAVRYVWEVTSQNDFSVAISSRPVAELLDLNDDNPVGWSFYFLKQVIHSFNS